MIEPRSLLETVAARISETLHVPQVAVLLGGAGFYRPAFAMGYASLPTVAFPSKTGTAMVLKSQKEPARVFLNDRDSWLYREEGISDEERGKLATLQSELLLPLAVRDKLLGFISLGPKRSEEPYTGSDVRLLKSVAAQTGLALENANLLRTVADEVAQRERLNREVEIAREVQERLFPQKLPIIRGSRLRRSLPARAGRRWRLLRLSCSAQRKPWHSDRRCLRQRNCRGLDDGQPAGLAAQRSYTCPGEPGGCCGQHQSPGVRGLLFQSVRDFFLWPV